MTWNYRNVYFISSIMVLANVYLVGSKVTKRWPTLLPLDGITLHNVTFQCGITAFRDMIKYETLSCNIAIKMLPGCINSDIQLSLHET